MKGESKVCYRCSSFERYYIKGDKRFNKTKFGNCRRHKKPVNMCDTCEKFSSKGYCRSERAIKDYLSELLTRLSEVKQIIEEGRGETEL